MTVPDLQLLDQLRDAINSHDAARVAECFAEDFRAELPHHRSQLHRCAPRAGQLDEHLRQCAGTDRQGAPFGDKRWGDESPWFLWRLWLLDFDQGLVGPFRSVEDVLELGGR